MASKTDALAFGLKLFQEILPLAVKGGTEAVAYFKAGSMRLNQMLEEGRDPTAPEWDQLNQRIDGMRGDLHTDDPDELGQAASPAKAKK